MEKVIKQVLLGADPEVFLRDIKTHKLISSIGLIGGSKDKPLYVGDNIFLQEDNVATEFSFNPSSTKEEYIKTIILGIDKINEKVHDHGLEVVIMSSAEFDDDQLTHPEAMMFGCDPDFNVWLEQQNLPANPLTVGNLRSCGGHIHIGYEKPDVKTSFNIVKAMDLFLGVPSVLADADERRRELYGKAGCFRLKKYGVEYRTLSNFWVGSKETIDWAWTQTQKAIDFVNDEQTYLCDNFKDQIELAINFNDKTAAEALIKEFNLTEITCVV